MRIPPQIEPDKYVIIRLGHGHTKDHSFQIGMKKAAETIIRESNVKLDYSFNHSQKGKRVQLL